MLVGRDVEKPLHVSAPVADYKVFLDADVPCDVSGAAAAPHVAEDPSVSVQGLQVVHV
jgi:hypothetical protein